MARPHLHHHSQRCGEDWISDRQNRSGIMTLRLFRNRDTNRADRESSMTHRHSQVACLSLYCIVCILVCVVFAAELPEQITLTNDTSNDYVLSSPGVLKHIRTFSPIKPRAVTSESGTRLCGGSLFSGYAPKTNAIVVCSISLQTVLRT